MYDLEILQQCAETKHQNVCGDKSHVCRSYRGKTGLGVFLPPPPPILNRVKVTISFMIQNDE